MIQSEFRAAPFSVIPTSESMTRIKNENRMILTEIGREYKCKRCNDYWPFDTEFFAYRKSRANGSMVLGKICRVCERMSSGRIKGA